MCGRTSLFQPQPEIERRFSAAFDHEYVPRYNIAPGDGLEVVRNRTPDAISRLGWGFVPPWMDDPDDGPTPINARAETARETPMFRDAFEEHRCLVLADGFYEWAGERGAKQPYRVVRDDRGLFAMAGLWSRWEGDDAARETVAVLTTDANDVVGDVHDRMPVILAPDEEGRWLREDDLDAVEGLLDPYPDDELQAYPVSRAVNDPANDRPDVVVEVDVDEQSDLDDFASD